MPDNEHPLDDLTKAAEDAITPATPVKIDPSASKAVGGTLMGALLLLATGYPAAVAVFGTRDVVKILSWFQSIEGGAYIGAAGFVATLVWRVTASWRRHIAAVIAYRAAPDDKAQVVATPGVITRLFGR